MTEDSQQKVPTIRKVLLVVLILANCYILFRLALSFFNPFFLVALGSGHPYALLIIALHTVSLILCMVTAFKLRSSKVWLLFLISFLYPVYDIAPKLSNLVENVFIVSLYESASHTVLIQRCTPEYPVETKEHTVSWRVNTDSGVEKEIFTFSYPRVTKKEYLCNTAEFICRQANDCIKTEKTLISKAESDATYEEFNKKYFNKDRIVISDKSWDETEWREFKKAFLERYEQYVNDENLTVEQEGELIKGLPYAESSETLPYYVVVALEPELYGGSKLVFEGGTDVAVNKARGAHQSYIEESLKKIAGDDLLKYKSSKTDYDIIYPLEGYLSREGSLKVCDEYLKCSVKSFECPVINFDGGKEPRTRANLGGCSAHLW